MSETLHNRQVAGRLLALKLLAYADRSDVLVLGLPRGGVPVAFEIAKTLRVPMDVFIVRKLGVPGYEELAMGAVATGAVEIIDPDVVEEFRLSEREISSVVKAEKEELRRRESVFHPSRAAFDIQNKAVILTDDGIATGSTMRAAIEGVRRAGAARIILAVGAAPLSTYLVLRGEADEVVCLLTPRDFRAVGEFYDEFPQLSDDDVRRLLEEAKPQMYGAA